MGDDRRKGLVIIAACVAVILLLIAETAIMPAYRPLWVGAGAVVLLLAVLAAWLTFRHRDE